MLKRVVDGWNIKTKDGMYIMFTLKPPWIKTNLIRNGYQNIKENTNRSEER